MNNYSITKLWETLLYNPKNPLLFNSGFFLLFFCVFLLFYIFIQNKIRLRIWFVVIVSVYFYYKSSGWYFLLMLGTSYIAHFLAIKIYLQRDAFRRKMLLVSSISIFLALLFYFKYTNFIIEIVNNFTTQKIEFANIFLPLGISFYTFELISYVVDVFHKKIKPLKRFIDFSFYVSFFPHLVAGPIVRPHELIPQIFRKVNIDNTFIGSAVYYLCMGLFKKAVISDYISSNFVDRIFDNPTLYSGTENILGAYTYTLQIYCDFSGYSDMAIGIALLMGFHLPNNFNRPYQATSITDFWRRWHISLSLWLRDYLYISLGGNRKGRFRTYINLFLTMLLGGLWHGANFKFIFWGALHGLALVVEKLFQSIFRSKNIVQQNSASNFYRKIKLFLGSILTFHFVTFCWIFFRATTFESAFDMIYKITDGVDCKLLINILMGYEGVFTLVIIGYVLHFVPKNIDFATERILVKTPLIFQSILLSLFIWLVIQVKSAEVLPFIYFQF